MKNAMIVVLSLLTMVVIFGCHYIPHVRDIRSTGDGKIEVEKCEYYINGFWGTGEDKGCKVEIVEVVKKK